jgi:invasion protein IalB
VSTYSVTTKLFILLKIILACLTFASGAQANTWQISCEQTCKVGQLVIADGRVVSRVIIHVLQGSEIVEVLLPLGISMLDPISIQIDGGDRYEVRIATCRADGCIGIVRSPNLVIQEFRRGFDMQLHFTGFDDGGGYFYPYDLRGFSAAYNEYRSID